MNSIWSKLCFWFYSFLAGNKTGRFSYGYSSFKGKRSSMEDFYETRISEVDGQMVAFFGVFDGMLIFLRLIFATLACPALFLYCTCIV